MSEYGWYLDDGIFGSMMDTLDDVIQEAVDQNAEDGDLSRVRVGPMVDIVPSDIVDMDDLLQALMDQDEDERGDAKGVARDLLCWADERVGELVRDGEVCTKVTDEAVAEMRDLLARYLVISGEIVRVSHEAKAALAAWLDKHVEPDPASYCEGEPVLPRELIDGEWCTHREGEPDAVITYTTEPSPETGHVGWVWWAKGKMGDAKTYAEAKAAAGRSLSAGCPDGDGRNGS